MDVLNGESSLSTLFMNITHVSMDNTACIPSRDRISCGWLVWMELDSRPHHGIGLEMPSDMIGFLYHKVSGLLFHCYVMPCTIINQKGLQLCANGCCAGNCSFCCSNTVGIITLDGEDSSFTEAIFRRMSLIFHDFPWKIPAINRAFPATSSRHPNNSLLNWDHPNWTGMVQEPVASRFFVLQPCSATSMAPIWRSHPQNKNSGLDSYGPTIPQPT